MKKVPISTGWPQHGTDRWTREVLPRHGTELTDAKPIDTTCHQKVDTQSGNKDLGAKVLAPEPLYQILGIEIFKIFEPTCWYSDLLGSKTSVARSW